MLFLRTVSEYYSGNVFVLFWPGSCTEGSSGYFGELPPKSMQTYLHQHLLAERNLFSQKKWTITD
jgi:hypothetical protein